MYCKHNAKIINLFQKDLLKNRVAYLPQVNLNN